MVTIRKNGTQTKQLVHRLVAETFLDNPNNLPQVHHIDGNTTNNAVDNLRWVSVAENIHESYTLMSPTRNYIKCALYKGKELLGVFDGIRAAARYAKENHNASYSMLTKWHKHKELEIIEI